MCMNFRSLDNGFHIEEVDRGGGGTQQVQVKEEPMESTQVRTIWLFRLLKHQPHCVVNFQQQQPSSDSLNEYGPQDVAFNPEAVTRRKTNSAQQQQSVPNATTADVSIKPEKGSVWAFKSHLMVQLGCKMLCF